MKISVVKIKYKIFRDTNPFVLKIVAYDMNMDRLKGRCIGERI